MCYNVYLWRGGADVVDALRVARAQLAGAEVVQPGEAAAAEGAAVERLEQARRPLQLRGRGQRRHRPAQRPRPRLQHLHHTLHKTSHIYVYIINISKNRRTAIQ